MWGKTPADAPEGIRLQNLAFDLGVNFFDTGDAYGNGHAEKLMVDTLKYAGRDKIVLSTKFGYDFYNDPGVPGGPIGPGEVTVIVDRVLEPELVEQLLHQRDGRQHHRAAVGLAAARGQGVV